MATINEKFVPIEAIHPTELIKDELKSRGMKRKEFAERLGMQESNLSRFLNGKGEISPSMAVKLESVLGIPADYWLRLQVSYNKDLEAIRQRNVRESTADAIVSVLATMFNIPVLFRELGISGHRYLCDKLEALCKAFRVNAENDLIPIVSTQGCFKKSDKLDTEDKNLNTWILLARHACGDVRGSFDDYVKGNENFAAKEIAKLANSQTITEQGIKSILNRYGIGYCVVKKIEKAPVDAYSTMIDGVPFIVVSHRRNNMDMLVFDVLHECGHINKHLTDGGSILSYNENIGDARGIELEANNYAKDMLIAPSEWAGITRSGSKSVNPYAVISVVVGEAKKRGISPTIAAWRYKYETGVYNIRGYKSPPIR